jgi:hypothetical protein
MSNWSYDDWPRGETVDTYGDIQVADPYRWAEDPDAPMTVDFVTKQNAISRPYLDSFAQRDKFKARSDTFWIHLQYSFDVASNATTLTYLLSFMCSRMSLAQSMNSRISHYPCICLDLLKCTTAKNLAALSSEDNTISTITTVGCKISMYCTSKTASTLPHKCFWCASAFLWHCFTAFSAMCCGNLCWGCIVMCNLHVETSDLCILILNAVSAVSYLGVPAHHNLWPHVLFMCIS